MLFRALSALSATRCQSRISSNCVLKLGLRRHASGTPSAVHSLVRDGFIEIRSALDLVNQEGRLKDAQRQVSTLSKELEVSSNYLLSPPQLTLKYQGFGAMDARLPLCIAEATATRPPIQADRVIEGHPYEL
jgi:hypothetical protein